VLGGRRLTRAEADALFTEVETACAAMTEAAAAVDADEPWNTQGAAGLDRRSLGDWLATLSISADARRLLAAELASNNGVAVERQSWLGNLAQVKGGGLERYWTDTEVWRCAEGTQALAQCLALELGRRRMRRSAVVKRIEYGDDGARIHVDGGTVLPADDVILTAPPSTWRKIEFDPPLPPELKPQMGVNLKFLATVQRRSWRDAGLAADGSTDGPIGFTWDATLGRKGEAACLTAFSGGPAARTCRSWPEDERERNYLDELERLFPGLRATFTRSRFMDWPADRWTLAGYSFPAPGELTTVAPRLRAGLGSLHFAGEHTCPAFVGYMEGALQSGVAIARKLAARDGVAALAR
jgi:monoamine oxidase